MLSTNTPSGIQRRRIEHRRQNSTPAAFEAHKVRPLPASTRQQRQQRSGMSLDLRGLNLESLAMPAQGSLPDLTNPATVDFTPFQQEENVSMTNLGQSSQQFMQVARTSQPQPGPQEPFVSSPVQQSLPSPRTPQRTLRPQSPAQPPLSPTKLPTEQELKNLHEHIQSVYGSCGQVFINILPTPTATPQKPTRLQSHDTFDTAPMPPNFNDMADINLEPTSSAMAFDFENPDADIGYESSSYYTSDALSPSPQSSPHQKSLQMFLEDIQELPAQELAYSDAPTLPLPARTNSIVDAFPFSAGVLAPSSVLTDPEVDASLEYTGISPEEVQRYISEQDLTTAKWTCMYPECGKQFGRRENIRAHVQTHLGDRQFRCNGCGKCFVRQHDLKRHSKIHTGKKPYTCPCSAGFARQDALTRHRQRGMCVGGFPDAVRRQAKRGRPKKTRPDLEERMDKASRTRRALASAASSISAESPQSDFQSGSSSPAPFDEYTPSGLPDGLPDMNSFGDTINASNDQMSFDTISSSFSEETKVHQESFASSSSFAHDLPSLNILQQLSRTKTQHTPPMSPADQRPVTANSTNSMDDIKVLMQSASTKGTSTPSCSSLQSNPFSTPPTSPVQPSDEFDELFNSLPDNSCSQFDMEMKAMSDFTSFDNSNYDFLDFSV